MPLWLTVCLVVVAVLAVIGVIRSDRPAEPRLKKRWAHGDLVIWRSQSISKPDHQITVAEYNDYGFPGLPARSERVSTWLKESPSLLAYPMVLFFTPSA
jgi:hypothetical protein